MVDINPMGMRNQTSLRFSAHIPRNRKIGFTNSGFIHSSGKDGDRDKLLWFGGVQRVNHLWGSRYEFPAFQEIILGFTLLGFYGDAVVHLAVLYKNMLCIRTVSVMFHCIWVNAFLCFFMLCFTYPRHKWVLNVLEASQLIEPVSVPVVLLWFSRLVPARLGTRLHPALSSALRRLKDLECQTDCRQKFHFWWSIALCWHKKLWMRACTWRCWGCCEKCGNSSSPIHLW